MIFVDLILDSGELVRIECPESFTDALYDSLEHAMKRGDWWSPAQFESCTATFLGVNLDRVAMRRVIGML